MSLQLAKRLTWREFTAEFRNLPWRGLFSTVGLTFGVLVLLVALLRHIEKHAGPSPRPLADEFYAGVLYLFAVGVIIFSLWRSSALKKALERGLDSAPRGSLQHWVFYGGFAVGAVVVLAMVQWLNQAIGTELNNAEARGEPSYNIYQALRAFLGIWALVVAYKCKIFWDVGINAVAPREPPRGRSRRYGLSKTRLTRAQAKRHVVRPVRLHVRSHFNGC